MFSISLVCTDAKRERLLTCPSMSPSVNVPVTFRSNQGRALSAGLCSVRTNCSACGSVSAIRIMSQQPQRSISEEITAVLNRAHQEGRTAEVFRVIASSFDQHDQQAASSALVTQGQMRATGAMSDASKRQRSASHHDPDWELAGDDVDGATGNGGGDPSTTAGTAATVMGPVPPNPANFPPGIMSIQQWGNTVCELPKVKSRRATYRELVQMSIHEDDLRQYFTKFVLKHNGPSPKVRDLRRFLEAIDYKNIGQPPPVYYPNSDGAQRVMR